MNKGFEQLKELTYSYDQFKMDKQKQEAEKSLRTILIFMEKYNEEYSNKEITEAVALVKYYYL